MRKSRYGFLIGSIMVIVLALLILAGDWLVPNDPEKINIAIRLAPPTSSYPLGTDVYGRCILSRLILGARYSIGLSVLVVAVVAAGTIPIGTAATCKGGLLDKLFLLTCDISMALPPTVLVLAIMGVLGNGISNLIFSSVFSYWGWYGRMVRSYTRNELVKEYIIYAKTGGATPLQIMALHILPNIAPSLIVLLTLGIGDAIMMISGFSFLGIGLSSGTPEWGSMLAEAKGQLLSNPSFVICPGVCVLFAVSAFNLLGEGLRTRLSPYRKRDYE